MNNTENICPVCKESNESEAVVCGHCGAALENPSAGPNGRTKRTDLPVEVLEHIKDWPVDEKAVPEIGIAIYIEGEYTPVHVDSRGEFVIGRKSGKTSEVLEKLLDLSPKGGYGRGVSRRHAVIMRAEQGYEILDLGSANGTWVNNERLVPQKPYPLDSGTHLRLGNMRLFVLYRPPAGTKQDS